MKCMETIKSSWHRLVARQLSMPSGILAKLVANKMNESNRLLYQLTLDSLQVESGNRILEIGFGNGKFFSDLDARASNLVITGIDRSHEMVTQAVINNSALFENGRMKVRVGNSDDLPFENESFDKVFCVNVIYFWQDPTEHLNEIYRVLKPGGEFSTGFKLKEKMAKMPFTKYGFNLYSEEEWVGLLERSNFKYDRSSSSQGRSSRLSAMNPVVGDICITARK